MFYYDSLKKYLANKICLDEDSFINVKEYQDLKNDLSSKKTYIIIDDSNDLGRTENQSNVNLVNEININAFIKIDVITDDVDTIIEYEDKFSELFNTPQDISEFSNDSFFECSKISLNNDKEITHENLENNKFKASIYLVINDVIWSKEIINPTKIELDNNSQKQIMEHLCLVDMTWALLFEKRNELIDSVQVNESEMEDDIINNLDSETKEQYNNLTKQMEDLEKQADEMFNFKKICSTEMTLEKHSFWNCRRLMIENNIDIKEACNLLDKEEKKEADKRKHADKVYVKTGDDVLNEYTDKVLEEIKNSICVDYPVSIYGGSTFMKYFHDKEYGRIKYPVILITDNTKYNLNLTDYETENEQGEIIKHRFSTTAYPIEYGIILEIISDSEQTLKELEEEVISEYSAEKELRVNDPIYDSEYRVLKLLINKDYKITYENSDSVYKNKIIFNLYPNVYYYKSYTSDDIQNNTRLQLRQLQQAEFCLLAENKIQTDLLKPIKKDLKGLIEQPNTTSFLGGLGSKISDNLFASAEYKQLKDCFVNHRPVDKALFDKVFEKTVKIYPSLFDKVMNGWTIQQFIDEIEPIKKQFHEQYITICNNLDIPETIEGYNQGSGRNHNALIFYINQMVKSPTTSLRLVFKKYKIKLDEERIAREKEQEELEAQRAEQGYNGGGNNGGSLLGGIMKTATGVALGNKMSGNSRRRDGKKDLFGTSVCQRCNSGKRNMDRFTCIGCPAESRCTKQYR